MLRWGLLSIACQCIFQGDGKDFHDDIPDSVQHLRQRLQEYPSNTTLGIVMFSPAKEKSYSSLTIPVWRAYCKKHGFDFFHQEEPLVSRLQMDWTKPRLLLELVEHSKWKYMFIVDAFSMPINMKKSWQDFIREHLRYRRNKNDKPRDRLMFCPWECEDTYSDRMLEGACHGPQLSGCILHSKKKLSKKLLTAWFDLRDDIDDPDSSTAVRRALEQTKQTDHYSALYWKDVQNEIGKRQSNFMITFGYDKTHRWDIRKQVHDYLSKNKLLGDIVNQEL